VRFLFTIQGEGRGHFTQALSLSYLLRKNGHEVVAALVGKSESREIPSFFKEKIQAPVFHYNSPNFTLLYKNKRPNIFAAVLDNAVRPMYFRKSIQFVNEKILEYKPDVVINFRNGICLLQI
jgi:UDP-N-acetylglucosamine:LPS N-acetylglucosamine transferase